MLGDDGAYQTQVLTITGSGISRNVTFQDSKLFATFGLPASLTT